MSTIIKKGKRRIREAEAKSRKRREVAKRVVKAKVRSEFENLPIKRVIRFIQSRSDLPAELKVPIPIAIIRQLRKEIQDGTFEVPGSLNDAVKFVGRGNVEVHLTRPETRRRGDDIRGQRYSFAGPGTNLDKRLTKADKPKAFSKPLNGLDRAAYFHDLAYRDSDNDDIEARNRADAILAKKAKQFLIKEAKYISDFRNGLFVQKIMLLKTEKGI